jgi:DNA-binding MltR family transcriptional regulator
MKIETATEFLDRFRKHKEKIGISDDYLFKLSREDDWSFIIKTSAILESATADVLTKVLGFPNLEDCISKLKHTNERSGRLTFLEKLSIINDEELKLIIKISKIRDDLAHKPEEINFTFERYFKKMNKINKNNWKDLFTELVNRHTQEEIIFSNPKQCITYFTMEILIKFQNIILENERKPKGGAREIFGKE